MAQKRDRFQMTADERTTIKKLEMLTAAVEKIYPKTGMLLWRSFLSGLFVALGGTVGLAIVLAIVTFVLSQTENIPVLKHYVPAKQIEKVLPDTTK